MSSKPSEAENLKTTEDDQHVVDGNPSTPLHIRLLKRIRLSVFRVKPARILLIGYIFYIVVGWILLSLPAAKSVDVAAIDALFIATSAVSTTGLITIDLGASFTLFGEVVILLLMQIGGSAT